MKKSNKNELIIKRLVKKNKNLIIKNEKLKHIKLVFYMTQYQNLINDYRNYIDNKNVEIYSIQENINENNSFIEKYKHMIIECRKIKVKAKKIETDNSIYIKDKDIDCAICLDTIEYGISTKCKHFYHYKCINQYIDNFLQSNSIFNISCPICRTKL